LITPVGETTLIIAMVMAFVTGMPVGMSIRAHAHEEEIESIPRIARRVETAKMEKAPKSEPCPPENRLPC
jgi:hypothetical protein